MEPEALSHLRPPPTGRKLRVLALHGGGSNSNIMQYQVMQLRQVLGHQIEWTFLNGGVDWTFSEGLEPPRIMESLADGMGFKGWYEVAYEDDSDRPYIEKLTDLSVTFTYKEVEVGAERVMKYIQDEGPFDVLLCFSQGCIISHLVLGTLRQRGEAAPWRLSVLFSGMRVRDNRYLELFHEPFEVPTVMVFGRQDEFYEYGRQSQAALYERPLVLEHNEGHKFPTVQPRAREIYEQIKERIFWHCGVPA